MPWLQARWPLFLSLFVHRTLCTRTRKVHKECGCEKRVWGKTHDRCKLKVSRGTKWCGGVNMNDMMWFQNIVIANYESDLSDEGQSSVFQSCFLAWPARVLVLECCANDLVFRDGVLKGYWMVAIALMLGSKWHCAHLKMAQRSSTKTLIGLEKNALTLKHTRLFLTTEG